MKKVFLSIFICVLFITGCVNPQSGVSSLTSEMKTSSSESMLTSSSGVLENDDYIFKIIDNSVTILKYKGNAKDITIPDTIDGFPIMVFDQNAFKVEAIERFVFPSNMKIIPDNMFDTALNLEEVILPPNCETIEAGAFRETNSLQELYIPDSVVNISPYAFECPREFVLLYDNNPIIAQYAKDNHILCFKRSEYNPVLTVELVGGKPLNDVENLGVRPEIYNMVRRTTPNGSAIKDINDYYNLMFDRGVYTGYISFFEGDDISTEAIKQKLTKTATLLYQCEITEFDPKTVNTGEVGCFDKLVTAAIYCRSSEELKREEINGFDVRFVDDELLYCETTGLFDVIPETSLVTGYSEQQHGIWYYPKELPKITTEVLLFSGNLQDGNIILKVKFTNNVGVTCEKTFSYTLVQYDSVGGDNYRVILKSIE